MIVWLAFALRTRPGLLLGLCNPLTAKAGTLPQERGISRGPRIEGGHSCDQIAQRVGTCPVNNAANGQPINHTMLVL